MAIALTKNCNYFFVALLVIVQFASSQAMAFDEKKDSLSLFQNSPKYHPKRTLLVSSVLVGGSAISFIGLNELWYKDYPKEKFHFFDDNGEWLQMDKLGHTATSFKVGKVGIAMLKWSGVKRKKAIWYGGLSGSAYLLGVEILDGFSSGWGFSTGDFAANTFGSALLVSQHLAWNETKIEFKYSYTRSQYAQYRPNLLGSNYPERLLKDYNGQTYWLSFGPSNFVKRETKFPKWINIAIGYGGDGMIGGHENPLRDATGIPYPHFERYRQYYLALDINLSKIETRYKWLNSTLDLFGFLKIPAPAIEFNKVNGLKFHPVYF